jgi:TonB family protein
LEELQSRVRYPAQARSDGVEGRVFVQFVVDREGAARALRVTRGVHPELDAEAVRVVRETSFTPGRQRGEPVCVQMSLPVTFRLDGAAAPPRPAAPVVEPVQSAASTVQSATASASDAVSEQAAQVDRTTQALTQQTTAAAGSVEASANAISESVDSTKAAVATSAATTRESLGGAKESLTGTFRSLFGRGKEAGDEASVPTADGAEVGDGDGNVPAVGATLAARIDNIALRTEASAEAAVVAQVTTEEALIYLGESTNGFLLVQSSAGRGWVNRVLVVER